VFVGGMPLVEFSPTLCDSSKTSMLEFSFLSDKTTGDLVSVFNGSISGKIRN
jgi:hypothetical protein